MKPCVTVSLVSEARGGPFIFWDDLPAACRTAARLGYAAIEVFPHAIEALDANQLAQLLRENQLALATIGTGGGWVKHKLTLTSSSAELRGRAREFISAFIDFAAPFGAAVIIGSMQGRAEGEISRAKALEFLGEALNDLAARAAKKGVTILYEHLNRYETNLLNRIEDVLPFLDGLPANVRILADLFHMNIEEASIADAIRAAGDRIGHIHFVDSNRRPAGLGHTDFEPIFAVLREIKYEGYISAEAFPYPDSDRAAEQTIRVFRGLVAAEK
ncbi:MAG TPA: sugar phosphate isomerase/epimerase family protein [Verrucomicrobiae bacterium]|jgi:sugar phosphate isomerase/epimerase|nr:sugar phosphate isomerase/epimerase family protein [Verrucomicrobiae bacterium]